MMAEREHLEDLAIRERQLETHLLHSPDYLRRCNRAITRQVVMLYLAIAVLILVQGVFTLTTVGQIPVISVVLTTITSLLAIVNCLFLIRAKACLRRLNDTWLRPEERMAVDALRHQRSEILAHDSPAQRAAEARRN